VRLIHKRSGRARLRQPEPAGGRILFGTANSK
jgi:hypothetical protein